MPSDDLDDNPLNTAQVAARLQPAPGLDRHRRRRRARPSRSPAPTTAFEFDSVRSYPEGELFAHVTGFFSFRYGATGVERSTTTSWPGTHLRAAAAGLRRPLRRPRERRQPHRLAAQGPAGRSPATQLGEREGSVVASTPAPARSSPSGASRRYDPNALSHPRPGRRRGRLDAAQRRPRPSPLRAHQYQDRFFPGSTFKVVTGTAGLETGGSPPRSPSTRRSTSYTAAADRPGRSATSAAQLCGGAAVRDPAGLVQHGVRPDGRRDHRRRRHGRRRRVVRASTQAAPIDLPGPAGSVFPTDFEQQPARSWPRPSIGQNDVQATPLQMALVAAGVANDGVIMTPHVHDRGPRRRGRRRRAPTSPAMWTQPDVAPRPPRIMREAMSRRRRATAPPPACAIAGFEVGGKTGTAQLGTDPPRSHAWIIGFAGPPGQPASVAVAVVVLDQAGGQRGHRRPGRRADRPGRDGEGPAGPVRRLIRRGATCPGRRRPRSLVLSGV